MKTDFETEISAILKKLKMLETDTSDVDVWYKIVECRGVYIYNGDKEHLRDKNVFEILVDDENELHTRRIEEFTSSDGYEYRDEERYLKKKSLVIDYILQNTAERIKYAVKWAETNISNI